MSNIPKLSKFFLTLTLLFGSLWYGSYVIRYLLMYQIFDGPTLPLKSYVKPEINLDAIFISINPVFVMNMGLYGLFILVFALFLFTSKISLKNNGWLFISTLIIVLTIPYEVFLFFKYDLQWSLTVNTLQFNASQLHDALVERIRASGTYAIVMILSHLVLFYLMVFRPFTKRQTELNSPDEN